MHSLTHTAQITPECSREILPMILWCRVVRCRLLRRPMECFKSRRKKFWKKGESRRHGVCLHVCNREVCWMRSSQGHTLTRHTAPYYHKNSHQWILEANRLCEQITERTKKTKPPFAFVCLPFSVLQILFYFIFYYIQFFRSSFVLPFFVGNRNRIDVKK